MRANTFRIVLTAPLAAALFALSSCNKAPEPAGQEPETQVAAQPQESAAAGAQSTEWVKEPAEPQGVKVDLPDTPMTNAPAEGVATAKKAE